MTKLPTKYRPKRVFKNKKGYYFIVNKKKRYIKLGEDISEKKLININIKNVMGYVARKNKTTRAQPGKKVTQGAPPTITSRGQSTAFSPGGLSGYQLLFNKQFVPHLQNIAQPVNSDSTKALTDIIKGLADVAKEYKPLMIKDKPSAPTIEDKPSVTAPSFFQSSMKKIRNTLRRRSSNLGPAERVPVNKPSQTVPPPTTSEASPMMTPRNMSDIGLHHTPAPSRVVELTDASTSAYKPKRQFSDMTQQEYKRLYKYIAKVAPDNIQEPSGVNTFYSAQNLKRVIGRSNFMDTLSAEEFDKLVNGFSGKGPSAHDDDGLYTDEIEKILQEKTHRIIPVIASDQVKTLAPLVDKNTKDFAFVMNLDNSKQPGSHWVAVYISRPDASVEYYDSLVHQPTREFMRDIKLLVEKMEDNVYYKFKVNMIKDQSDDSSNCGYFAINFLDKRLNGGKFKEASLWQEVDASGKGEKEIERYKSYI